MRKWFPKDLQYWNCSKPPKLGYSGTCIMISKDFEGGRPDKVEYDGFGEEGLHDQEGRTITLHFKTFIFVASYVPNSGVASLKRLNYRVDSWDKDFHHYLKSTLEVQHRKPVICAGDLNVAWDEIDIYSPKTHKRQAGFTDKERSSFANFLKNTGFVDTFRHQNPDKVCYSFYSARSKARPKGQGWRSDYFLASRCLLLDVAMADMTTLDAMVDIAHMPSVGES